jgi:hypothetical protein
MLRLLRRVGVATVSLVALVALSGCLKVDMDLTFNSDDTVSGSMIMAFDKSFITQSGMTEEQFTDQMLNDGSVTGALLKGGRVEKYSDDKYSGMKLIFDKVPLSQFNDVYSSGSDDNIKITHADGKFVVDGVMDFTADASNPENPLGGLAGAMMSSFTVRIAMTFPGKILESTGKVSGHTVVWEPKFGEKATIHAVASDKDESSVPVALIAGAGGGVVLVGLAVLFFFLMRRKPTPATVGAPMDPTQPYPPAPYPPSQYQPPQYPTSQYPPQAYPAPPYPPQDPPTQP